MIYNRYPPYTFMVYGTYFYTKINICNVGSTIQHNGSANRKAFASKINKQLNDGQTRYLSKDV